MSSGGRPSGLTAMAVVNFVYVFGALIGLATVGLFVLWKLNSVPASHPEVERIQSALDETSIAILVTIVVLNVIKATLLFLSGIGYLTQRKMLGRVLGSGYAVIGLLLTGTELILPAALDGGMINVMTG